MLRLWVLVDPSAGRRTLEYLLTSPHGHPLLSRRFEFSDSKSHKIWEIPIDDRTLAVRFGRVGTSGQPMTKELDAAEAARQAAEKQVAEKVRNGYSETGATPPTTVPVPVALHYRWKVSPGCRVPRRSRHCLSSVARRCLPPIAIGFTERRLRRSWRTYAVRCSNSANWMRKV